MIFLGSCSSKVFFLFLQCPAGGSQERCEHRREARSNAAQQNLSAAGCRSWGPRKDLSPFAQKMVESDSLRRRRTLLQPGVEAREGNKRARGRLLGPLRRGRETLTKCPSGHMLPSACPRPSPVQRLPWWALSVKGKDTDNTTHSPSQGATGRTKFSAACCWLSPFVLCSWSDSQVKAERRRTKTETIQWLHGLPAGRKRVCGMRC